MKQLRKIFVIILFFIASSASAQYLESFEPINVFLETQKIDKKKKYILQAEKGTNKQALRIFNGGEGPDAVEKQNVPIDYREGLFVEKYWKEMYSKYAEDTIQRYWKREDFPAYDFILENKERLFKGDFYDRYTDSSIDQLIVISEPMYYMDKRYIMFYINIGYFDNSVNPQVVIMKKEEGKWVVVKRIGDYVFH